MCAPVLGPGRSRFSGESVVRARAKGSAYRNSKRFLTCAWIVAGHKFEASTGCFGPARADLRFFFAGPARLVLRPVAVLSFGRWRGRGGHTVAILLDLARTAVQRANAVLVRSHRIQGGGARFLGIKIQFGLPGKLRQRTPGLGLPIAVYGT